MYRKAKIHKGSQAKCKVCMAKIAAVDPEFAAKVSKLTAIEDKKRNRCKQSQNT